METLPIYIGVSMVLTTCLAVFIFYKAANSSKRVLQVILVWLAAQSFLSLRGFYSITDTIPPRFVMLVAPPILFIVILFLTVPGRRFLDSLDPKYLTLLHTVRVAVELVLFWLFLYKTVPQIMTFEGRNLDIISGLTAPLLFYFGFFKKIIASRVLLLWNLVCLGLLINIVSIAILSAPFPFQKLAFDQPNIALLYFPFIWLPCCIVPLVLLSHLAAIRQLLLKAGRTTASKVVAVNSAGQ